MHATTSTRWLTSLAMGLALALTPGCGDDSGGGDGGAGEGGMDGGRDAGGGGGDDGSVPPADGSDDFDACEAINIDTSRVATNVLIVLDTSNSMYQPDDGVNRWDPAVTAIENVTGSLADRIRFGLMLFPGDGECGAGAVAVSPDLGNATAISDALNADDADGMTAGGTPIAPTMASAADALSGADGDRYVLLVTDGAPNCNSELDPNSCDCTHPDPAYCDDTGDPFACLDDDQTLDNITTNADAGIGTYVIGYESDFTGVLDAMAAAGGTDRDTHIPVSDGTALETALEDVSASAVSCSYELDSDPGAVRYVRVEVDGMTVDHTSATDGGTEGWELTGEKTVELVGSTCDMVQDGEPHEIDITVECEPLLE